MEAPIPPQTPPEDNRRTFTAMAVLAVLLALAFAWWSLPGSSEVPEGRPLASGGVRPVPVPVDPSLAVRRVAPETPEQEPVLELGSAPRTRDTGVPQPMELVMPVGEGCEGLEENADRLESLLAEVKDSRGSRRRHILRQIGPLMQSVEVEGCDPVPDYRPEVTTVLCDELKDRPDDMELMLVAGFAEVRCE